MHTGNHIYSGNHEKAEHLYTEFSQLDEYERAILTVLAVIYKPIGIGKLHAVIDTLLAQGFLAGEKKHFRLSIERKAELAEKSLIMQVREGLCLHPLICNRLIDEIDSIAVHVNLTAQSKLVSVLMSAEAIVPVISPESWQKKHLDEHRLVRDFYFLGELDNVEDSLDINRNPQVIQHQENQALLTLFFMPFDQQKFLSLPPSMQYQAMATLVRHLEIHGQNSQYAVDILEMLNGVYQDDNSIFIESLRHLLALQYLYHARFDDFARIQVENDQTSFGLQLLGAHAFLQGQNEEAIAYFEQAIKAKNKLAKRKNQYLNDSLGYFYKLALIVQANKEDASLYDLALTQIQNEEKDRKVYSDLDGLAHSLAKPIHCLSYGEPYHYPIQYHCVNEQADYFTHSLHYFTFLLAHAWCNDASNKAQAQISDDNLHTLALKYRDHFTQLGYTSFARFCEQLAIHFLPAHEASRAVLKAHGKLIVISKLIAPKPQWEVALDKLIALKSAPHLQAVAPSIEQSPEKQTRLIWELALDFEHSVRAREQKQNKSGWTKGRVVSLQRLKDEQTSFDYLSESDVEVCKAITVFRGYGYYAKTEYALAGIDALKALVGVNNLYLEGDYQQPIELRSDEPELLVSQQGQQLCLSIADIPTDIEFSDKKVNYTLTPNHEHQYRLTIFNAQHLQVASVVGESGLLVPVDAKEKVLAGISAIAPMLNIQSDLAELDTGLQKMECDHRLYINIEPVKTSMTYSCVVMPFGEKGPAFSPGVGNANLSAQIDGKRVSTTRDLLREQHLLDELDACCPAFLSMTGNILILEDFQNALDVLEQLELAIAQAKMELSIRWPKGKKITLSKPLKSEHLQLALSKQNEWFDISGDLQVDDEQVIALRKLLELVKTSNGRFIELASDQIIALSDDLRKRLALIEQVTDEGKFHPLASAQIEQAATGMRMKTIDAWDKQTKRMHEANNITPQVPTTFQGELRDYQLIGFDWAMRLAHWGAGACLADDMGLGKTLQALSVLLARASEGPSLIIAPTSVCFNWQQEAQTFAPTLNIQFFAEAQGKTERLHLLKSAGPFDCVIITYGLLQRESDILSDIQWRSIVADEAQALKNPLAKRSKAAFALKGEFKMITTGTPIENNLSELWSLFRFVNPGLLGNLKQFAKRYIQPIENAKEDPLKARKASQALKALLQPFILRRMKHQVLSELPPRTDINITVQMNAKEQAFYEALRLNAIDNIQASTQQSNAGEQRIKMLAELVKLRQACCHPKLVVAESDIPSAKLAALDELLDELVLNKHKALIFSQFVGHLQLIKQHLEAKGLDFQYLDGSTAQKARQQRVNDFQSGKGDVFLISLKAGGSGLNLTAADYVIHMDPWWNPAVEEQASDRAHRIGQQRPVTIYRLITQNTVEEKIVALHAHKRDLADKLLSDNETVSKLSVEDMLNLLKDTL